MGNFDQALQIIEKLLATKSLSAMARAKYERRIHRYSHGIPFQI
ncbi:MAG: hypothetical protein NZ789_16695 [Pseudomonadales bacterium]|nr:hypothetical protein [Pseudomonadales bacterium]